MNILSMIIYASQRFLKFKQLGPHETKYWKPTLGADLRYIVVIVQDGVFQLIEVIAIILYIGGTIFHLASYLCVTSFPFYSPIAPLLCSTENNFCWQSAEIRLPFHLGLIYCNTVD